MVTAQHVDSGRMYIEGAIQFLVVKHSGDLVTRRRFERRTAVTLHPGRYWVSSYARPCDANCGFLDPPVDRCATYVSVPAHQTVAATVRISVGRDCSLRLHRKRS